MNEPSRAPVGMTVDRGRTEHPEEPAEGGREKGEEVEARVREEQQNDERPGTATVHRGLIRREVRLPPTGYAENHAED